MRRVLLAGCGDLGQRAARLLLEHGDEVWALRRSAAPTARTGIRWLSGDLTQPHTLTLPPQVDCMAFLAAPDARTEAVYRAVFVDGLRHLAQALQERGLQRIVFVSSSAVYGEHQGAWVTEETPAHPLASNGRMLLQAENWLTAQSVSSTCLRLAGLYGPGRLQLIERLRAGQASAPRHPPHWANRIHIEDAAAAVAHLLHLPAVAPVYVGADDTPLPLHELYSHLAHLIGAPTPAAGPAPKGVGSKKLSNARLRASGLALQWPDARLGYRALLQI